MEEYLSHLKTLRRKVIDVKDCCSGVLFQKMEQMRERMQHYIRRGDVVQVDPANTAIPEEDKVYPAESKVDWVVKAQYALHTKDPKLRNEIRRVFDRFYQIRERWSKLKSPLQHRS